MRRTPLLTLAAVCLLAVGCRDSMTDPVGGLDVSSAELADVALQSDLSTESTLNAELDAMQTAHPTRDASDVRFDERTFRRSGSCPAGGEFSVEGSIRRTFDPATGVMEAELAGSRSRDDCAFVRGDLTITVNSTASWESFRRRLDGRPDGPQTSHYAGSLYVVRSDGTERRCEFEYTIVRDPDAGTRTLEGTICGDRTRRSVAWNLSD